MVFLLLTASPLTSSKFQVQPIRSRRSEPTNPTGQTSSPKPGPLLVTRAGGATSTLERFSTFGHPPGFPQDSGNPPCHRLLGRDAPARARPRPPAPRDPSCWVRTQGPRARRAPAEGPRRELRFRGRRGRGFPAGRAATSQSRLSRQRQPRAKIKPGYKKSNISTTFPSRQNYFPLLLDIRLRL